MQIESFRWQSQHGIIQVFRDKSLEDLQSAFLVSDSLSCASIDACSLLCASRTACIAASWVSSLAVNRWRPWVRAWMTWSCAAWFVSTVCRMYHCVFYVFHLLSDPMGLLDKLVHDISLILQNHLQLRWLLKLLDNSMENISLLKEHISSLLILLFSCALFSATTLAGRFPNANCLSCTAFTRCCWLRSLGLTCSASFLFGRRRVLKHSLFQCFRALKAI